MQQRGNNQSNAAGPVRPSNDRYYMEITTFEILDPQAQQPQYRVHDQMQFEIVPNQQHRYLVVEPGQAQRHAGPARQRGRAQPTPGNYPYQSQYQPQGGAYFEQPQYASQQPGEYRNDRAYYDSRPPQFDNYRTTYDDSYGDPQRYQQSYGTSGAPRSRARQPGNNQIPRSTRQPYEATYGQHHPSCPHYNSNHYTNIPPSYGSPHNISPQAPSYGSPHTTSPQGPQYNQYQSTYGSSY